MRKRLLFIGVVMLVASSAASAGVWDWLCGFTWPLCSPGRQGQVTRVTAGNVVANQGVGTASNTNGGTFGGTQISPSGTQSSRVTVSQNGTVTGYSPNSFGRVVSRIQVTTYQNHSY